MPDFWPDSGLALLKRDGQGQLAVTDDYLRAWLARPEIALGPEACPAERALHAAVMAAPRAPIAEARIAALRDADARDNWRVLADFFRRLAAAGTVEGCYLGLFHEERVPLPPLFLDRLVETILRAILDGTDDPFRVRAAELFFRPQTATVQEGSVLLGDSETVETLGATRGMGDLGRLIVQSGTKPKNVEMDVLTAEKSALYWERSARRDLVLDLTFARPGLDALARVMESWIAHMIGAEVRIQPVRQIRDERWVWHTGLDVEASAILNDLYRGAEVDEERLKRLIALFRLDFANPSIVREGVAGRPVYLGLAITEARKLRVKPQNLLVNLPLAREA
ncbi:MAG: hypothetical protein IT564_04045 [Rhodospirillales bacterium]|nr:hypothetical protein [Rhodospirillales bacterium]